MDERNFAQEMMNLNSNDGKLGGQFQGNFGGMEINAMKKWNKNESTKYFNLENDRL